MGENGSGPTLVATPPHKEATRGVLHKNWHYLFVGSLLTMLACALALANAAFDLFNVSSYAPGEISGALLVTGYTSMFLTVWISPIPDYILLPVYGYLCAIGIFSPYTTLLVCLAAAILPIEYAAGKFAGRPLLLKALSYFHITERDLEVADNWLVEHGKFSIFIATFIPFFYSAACLAAGTLKMKAVPFLLMSTLGFAVRYVFLECIGFYSIYVFTASFDYSDRDLFLFLFLLSFAYAVVHLVRTRRPRRGAIPSQGSARGHLDAADGERGGLPFAASGCDGFGCTPVQAAHGCVPDPVRHQNV